MSDLITPPAKHTLLAVRGPEPDHAGWRAECTCGAYVDGISYQVAHALFTAHLREPA